MSLFDIILLCVIGGFALFGVWFGLVHTLGSLVGTVVGVYLASRWYAPLADWLIHFTGWTGNFPRVAIFILSFLIINRLIGFGFHLLDKALSIVTRLPFISSIDRILGFAFGVVEGFIVLGITFYFINKFPLGPQFMAAFSASKIAPYCLSVSSILWPLIPEGLKILKDYTGIQI